MVIRMVVLKAMKQGVGMFMVIPRDACSKVCPYNMKGVWSHSMGDMPRGCFCLLLELCIS